MYIGGSMAIVDCPDEVLSDIAAQLGSVSDLTRLAETCKRLYHYFIPLIYRQDIIDASSTLTWALQKRRVSTIERVLEQNADGAEMSHLTLAAESGDCSTIEALLQSQSVLQDCLIPGGLDRNRRNPLSSAARGGHVDAARRLLMVPGIDVVACDAVDEKLQEESINSLIQLYRRGDDKHLTPLMAACIHGHLDMCKLLLENGANLSQAIACVSCTITPLRLAILSGDETLIRFLIKHGGDSLVTEDVSQSELTATATLMHLAAKVPTTGTVYALLEHGVSVDTSDEERRTPLHEAAANGYLQIAKAFIGSGTDVDAEDSDGHTPLHLATLNNHPECARFLLSAGANPSARNEEDETPLHYAASHGDVTIIQHLVQQGADVNAANSSGKTPLHSAAAKRQLDVMRVLVDLAADLGAVDHDGCTILHEAVNVPVATYLLDRGADIHATANGATPMLYACQDGDLELVELLIRQGADTGAVDADGWTALHYAAMNPNIAITNLLLEQKVDVLAQDIDGVLPLLIALEQNNFDVARSLLQAGSDVNARDNEGWPALFHLLKQPDNDLIEMMVQRGAALNLVHWGTTALHRLVINGMSAYATKLMLDHGADQFIREVEDGDIPLHWAASGDNVEAAEQLILHGAHIDSKNEEYGFRGSETPLMCAARKDAHRMVEWLLSNGADAAPVSDQGATALSLAAEYARTATVRLLLDRTSRDSFDKRDLDAALMTAAKAGNLDNVRLLLKHGAKPPDPTLKATDFDVRIYQLLMNSIYQPTTVMATRFKCPSRAANSQSVDESKQLLHSTAQSYKMPGRGN